MKKGKKCVGELCRHFFNSTNCSFQNPLIPLTPIKDGNCQFHFQPKYVRLKDVLNIIEDERYVWSANTKYLNIFLDTRTKQIGGELYCLLKDKNNNYISLDDLKKQLKDWS